MLRRNSRQSMMHRNSMFGNLMSGQMSSKNSVTSGSQIGFTNKWKQSAAMRGKATEMYESCLQVASAQIAAARSADAAAAPANGAAARVDELLAPVTWSAWPRGCGSIAPIILAAFVTDGDLVAKKDAGPPARREPKLQNMSRPKVVRDIALKLRKSCHNILLATETQGGERVDSHEADRDLRTKLWAAMSDAKQSQAQAVAAWHDVASLKAGLERADRAKKAKEAQRASHLNAQQALNQQSARSFLSEERPRRGRRKCNKGFSRALQILKGREEELSKVEAEKKACLQDIERQNQRLLAELQRQEQRAATAPVPRDVLDSAWPSPRKPPFSAGTSPRRKLRLPVADVERVVGTVGRRAIASPSPSPQGSSTPAASTPRATPSSSMQALPEAQVAVGAGTASALGATAGLADAAVVEDVTRGVVGVVGILPPPLPWQTPRRFGGPPPPPSSRPPTCSQDSGRAPLSAPCSTAASARSLPRITTPRRNPPVVA